MKHWPARAAFTILLSAPALVWTVDLLASTPVLILVAATAPAVALGGVILVAQRGSRRPRSAMALALLWGAIGAAFLSSTGNELARPWMTQFAGEESRTATAVFVAPALEEGAKALGLLLLLLLNPTAVRNARDGIVYGALIGVGFVWTENLLYLGVSMLQGGEDGLMRGLYLRGILGGITHTVFTACSGAAIGWWASRNRRESAAAVPSAVQSGRGGKAAVLLVAALVLTIAQHAVWNALGAPMIADALCGAPSGGGTCTPVPTNSALFGSATWVAALFLAPGAALVTAAWRSFGATTEDGSS